MVHIYDGILHVCVCAKLLQLCPTLCDPMDLAHQTPLSMVFSRQEYWSGLSCPPPGDLPDPGIEPGSLALEADALTSEPPGTGMSKLQSRASRNI